jgi:hypothetical protein
MQSVRTEHLVVSNVAPPVAKSGRKGTKRSKFCHILAFVINYSSHSSMGSQIMIAID